MRGTEHENVVNEIVLRTQAQAEYVAENYGHFGLHLRRYAHFTSPIRRYADLIVHRALVRALHLGPGRAAGDEPRASGGNRGTDFRGERRAMAAERETTERLIATFLSRADRRHFPGPHRRRYPRRAVRETGRHRRRRVCRRQRRWALIISAYEEAQHALVGARTGETYQLGDAVKVKLVEAAPFAGALRFEMLSHGKGQKGRALSVKQGRAPKRAAAPRSRRRQ